MSVRAHLIKKIEYGDEVFNLWHDKYFTELLERNGVLDTLDTDLCGIIEIDNDILDNIDQCVKDDIESGKVGIKKEVNIKELARTRDIVKKIKDLAKKEGYVEFYCF